MVSLLIRTAFLCLAMVVCDTALGYPLEDLDSEGVANAEDGVRLELGSKPVETQSNLVVTLLEPELLEPRFDDENADDLELAEINVFRPVFRYRLALSKRVNGPPQF